MTATIRPLRAPLAWVLLGAGISVSSTADADISKVVCIELNTKGQDLRREGKLSEARDQFRKCSDRSCPAIVRDDCTKRLDEVDQAQPTIVFTAKDSAGNDVSAVRVAVDGKPLAERLDGTELGVDPITSSRTR